MLWFVIPGDVAHDMSQQHALHGHLATTSLYPGWLHVLAWIYLGSCLPCAAIMIIDEVRRPQKLVIMNFVWPLTALYGGPLSLCGYFKSARKMTKQHFSQMTQEVEREIGEERNYRLEQTTPSSKGSPAREQVAVAATHCGAGCNARRHCGQVVDLRCRADNCRRRTRNTISARFRPRVGLRRRFPILYDCADARPIPRQRCSASIEGRHFIDIRIPSWNVCLGPSGVFRPISQSAPEGE